MNTNIEYDPKYQLFFEILNNKCTPPSTFKIEDDTIFLMNYSYILVFDKNKQYDKLEIPNLKTHFGIQFYDLNCNEVIFNKIFTEEVVFSNSNFNSLKFECYKDTSIGTFLYFNRNSTTTTNNSNQLITIPNNINFRKISIEDNNNHIWKIEDNKYLESINFRNINIDKFNKYNSIKEIRVENTNLDFNQFRFNETKNLEKIIYIDYKNKIEKIDISDMTNLKTLHISVPNKPIINLENLPILNRIDIESYDYNDINDNYLDLGKINSDQLSSLTIKEFKIKNQSILYGPKITTLNISESSSEYIKGELISILLKDKTFNFYSPDKYDLLDYIDNYNFDENTYYFHTIHEFFTLVKSTDLMIKLISNDLDSITKEDLLTIDQKDIKGFKAISYCRTIEALKLILEQKNYILNDDDISLLSNEKLKSYYQRELIKLKISTKSIDKNNKIHKKCL